MPYPTETILLDGKKVNVKLTLDDQEQITEMKAAGLTLGTFHLALRHARPDITRAEADELFGDLPGKSLREKIEYWFTVYRKLAGEEEGQQADPQDAESVSRILQSSVSDLASDAVKSASTQSASSTTSSKQGGSKNTKG